MNLPKTTRTDSPGTATGATPSTALKTTNSCLGIPVRYDPDLKVICDSRGILLWKEIVVGPMLMSFPPREQQAFVLHEAGHCKLNHVEKRFLSLWKIFRPKALVELCHAQEYEADRFVRGCGYGADLARAFSRITPAKDPLHPPLAERISALVS